MDFSPLDFGTAFEASPDRPPSLRDRLSDELWSRTVLRLSETRPSAVTEEATRFFDGGMLSDALSEVIDPFTVGTLTSTFREWFLFDCLFDGKTAVESYLEGDIGSEERDVMRSWRDSFLSLYRVELFWGNEEAALFTDVFSGGSVRVDDFGELADMCDRGHHLATRLIADGPTWHIEGSWIHFPPVVELTTSGLRTAWEEYRASHPGSSKTEFLKGNGPLFYRLWTAEIEHVLARSVSAEADDGHFLSGLVPLAGGDLEGLRNALAGVGSAPEPPSAGDLEANLGSEPLPSPQGPCPCGSGRKYVYCCLFTDPRFLEAAAELVNLAEAEGPPGRPDRWQVDILRFSAREGAVASVGARDGPGPWFLVVFPCGELGMLSNTIELARIPDTPGELAIACRDALLDTVDGYADELPRVVEVRRTELEAPLETALGDVLGDVAVSVQVGEDFTQMEAAFTSIMTDVLTGGRATPPG